MKNQQLYSIMTQDTIFIFFEGFMTQDNWTALD